MKDDKCIVQNIHTQTDESADAKAELELLLAKLICKELTTDFAQYGGGQLIREGKACHNTKSCEIKFNGGA